MVDEQNEQDGNVGPNDQTDAKRPAIRWCDPDERGDLDESLPRGDDPSEQDRTERVERIAALNDLCRTAMGVAGIVRQTPGISALPRAVQSAIRERVETFNDFTGDNNPYGERDFGSFEIEGHGVFWKIDYYDLDLQGGSEDPSDQTQTTRVLTIMLASEY